MAERQRAPRRPGRRPALPGRDKLTIRVDSAILASIRELAKRKGARICDVTELAFAQLVQADTSERMDATLAPMIDRVIESRLKYLEGGLRRMIARLAFESLASQYILCNFLVEANIPASKVERWRQDGRKYAIQEYRRQRPEYEDSPTDDEDA